MNIELNPSRPGVLALYLPQYYETEYNNKWWGKGYTDWTALKNAKPLFKGHKQPRIPKDSYYYDLSNKEDIRKQAELAREYGVDGFAIYQYYSCGSTLLDTPVDILLNNKDIELPFFLFWANTSWRMAWYGQNNSVVWEQRYGDEKDWREQFEYCLRLFKDERYICYDNKPVYGIYRSWEFDRVDEFIDCWNKWAVEEGFNGIYFIKGARIQDKGVLGRFNAICSREPDYTLAYDESFPMHVYRFIRTRGLSFINKHILMPMHKGIVMYRTPYDWTWRQILKRNYKDSGILPGAFTDWDNSPRKGYNSYIVKGGSAAKFARYFKELYRISAEAKAPFILINAWNEWAEGAYLEPDEMNGYAYLEAIRDAKQAYGNARDE